MIEIDQHVLKIDKISTLRFLANASRALDGISHIFHPRKKRKKSIDFIHYFYT